MAASRVQLWVRHEPFLVGVLPCSPHGLFALGSLKRIIPYTKSKNAKGFPFISYSLWKHIACKKLLISEGIAWRYFMACMTLDSHGLTLLEKIEKRLSSCKSEEEEEEVKERARVNVMMFVVVMYIQLINKSTRSSSLLSLATEDKWPTPDRPTRSSTITGRTSIKIPEEQQFLPFVSSHIEEMIQVLTNSDDPHSCVSLEVVQALGCVIEGASDKDKVVRPLHDLVTMQSRMCGYIPTQAGFLYKQLVAWIQGRLCYNPYNISSQIRERLASWPVDSRGDKLDVARAERKTEKKISNVCSAPDGNKQVILHHVQRKTWAKSSSHWLTAHVKINRCSDSYLYLLSPTRSVTVSKCRSSLIVVGPVSTRLHLSGCRDVTIIAPARTVIISDSKDCILYLLTPSSPLLIGPANVNITLAPFNTTYGLLQEHMHMTGISDTYNLWSKPYAIVNEEYKKNPGCCKILPPAEFYIHRVPLDMDGNTQRVPGISGRYLEHVEDVQRRLNSWHTQVQQANLTDDQRDQLQELARVRFKSWLKEAGHDNELNSLEDMQRRTAKRRLFRELR